MQKKDSGSKLKFEYEDDLIGDTDESPSTGLRIQLNHTFDDLKRTIKSGKSEFDFSNPYPSILSGHYANSIKRVESS